MVACSGKKKEDECCDSIGQGWSLQAEHKMKQIQLEPSGGKNVEVVLEALFHDTDPLTVKQVMMEVPRHWNCD